METVRKPFQGVRNIIRFNWHFYVGALAAVLFFLLFVFIFFKAYLLYTYLFISLTLLSVLITLLVSWYVYDFSGLYRLQWLQENNFNTNKTIVNINAGFDETSELFKEKLAPYKMYIFDFYNAEKHTEVSIKRARKAYPPYPNTKSVETQHLPLPNTSVDYIFNILSAHEIRDTEERIAFFKELARILAPQGKIVVVEHLRDTANFLAYNIGFFHFHAKSTWLHTFLSANLSLEKEIKNTP